MKRLFDDPELEIVRFNASDIFTTASGGDTEDTGCTGGNTCDDDCPIDEAF